MAADTSSSAAATTDVVWVTAATFAAWSVEPTLARSVAAAATYSGAAITNDISASPDWVGCRSPARWRTFAGADPNAIPSTAPSFFTGFTSELPAVTQKVCSNHR